MKNRGIIFTFLLALFFTSSGCLEKKYNEALIGAFYPPWNEIFEEYCHGETPKLGCSFFVAEENDTLPPDIFQFRLFFGEHIFERDHQQKVVRDWCYLAQAQMSENFEETCFNENGDDVLETPGVGAPEESEVDKVYRKLGLEFAQKNKLPSATGIELARKLEIFARQGKNFKKRDIFVFAEDFYGVGLGKLADALNAFKEDGKFPEKVNAKIAAHWNSDPKITLPILERWADAALRKLGSKELIKNFIDGMIK